MRNGEKKHSAPTILYVVHTTYDIHSVGRNQISSESSLRSLSSLIRFNKLKSLVSAKSDEKWQILLLQTKQLADPVGRLMEEILKSSDARRARILPLVLI